MKDINKVFLEFAIGFAIGLSLGILIMIVKTSIENRNNYVQIRSEVWLKTGYDISYPNKWKGVCRE